MSNLTIHANLDHKIKKDGTQTVQIRIIQYRVSKRVSAGFSIEAVHWNAEKEEVRKSHPLYRQYNALLRSKKVELENLYLKDTAKGREVTAELLVRKVKKAVLGDNFFKYAKAHIVDLDSPASRKAQTSVIKKLEEYMKGRELFFDEIDYKFLTKYRKHLKGLGNSVNTIHANFKTIRGIYNAAVKNGDYKPELHAFANFKLKKERSHRIKLDEEQIEKIYNHHIRENINDFHAKNAFLFSFYAQGMRTADILQLTWGMIRGERIEYFAGKTGKFKSIKLRPRAVEILAIYRLPGAKPGDYVFPFLKNKKRDRYTDDQWLAIVSSANQIINQSLRNIARKTGLPDFSMHVARHSFAEMARRKTGDIYLVSEALDHSSVAVTLDYFAAAKQKENDDFADKVYG